MFASRSVGARLEKSVCASGVDLPTRRSPVVDMIETRLFTRAGCRMVSDWAIIPPIETPTTWAAPNPRPSMSPAVSSAMSWIP